MGCLKMSSRLERRTAARFSRERIASVFLVSAHCSVVEERSGQVNRRSILVTRVATSLNRLAAFAAVFAATWMTLPAAAQEQGDDRAMAFKAVQGPTEESISGGSLLVSAYIFAWLMIFFLVFRTARLQARTVADVERLERALQAAQPKD